MRLDGDDVRRRACSRATAAAGAAPNHADDGDASARISLRLSEALKAEIDAAAARDGVSVNTWLVRAAAGAPPAAAPGRRPRRRLRRERRAGSRTHRITGWING